MRGRWGSTRGIWGWLSKFGQQHPVLFHASRGELEPTEATAPRAPTETPHPFLLARFSSPFLGPSSTGRLGRTGSTRACHCQSPQSMLQVPFFGPDSLHCHHISDHRAHPQAGIGSVKLRTFHRFSSPMSSLVSCQYLAHARANRRHSSRSMPRIPAPWPPQETRSAAGSSYQIISEQGCVAREQPVLSSLLPSSLPVTGCTDFPWTSFPLLGFWCGDGMIPTYTDHLCEMIVPIHGTGGKKSPKL